MKMTVITEQMRESSLPDDIQKMVGSKAYSISSVGMSGSEVRVYDRYVLKIQPHSEECENEYAMVNWLGNQIPVPQIPVYCTVDGLAYTLMTRVEGEMLCSDANMNHPEMVIKTAAAGLRQLWAIDVKECPFKTSKLDQRLKAAEYRVSHGLVDVDNTEPGTFGPGGFQNPEELLAWLKDNRPKEDIVLTHGDFCLPNIFVNHGNISGLIDLGKMGPADRWQDVAIAIRSLKHNFDGMYNGGKKIFDFEPDMLLEELGIDWDAEKYRYYLLLDELF